MSTRERAGSKERGNLALALRCLGVLDFSALLVVFVPASVFTGLISHSGLGEVAVRPLDVYLAKTTSALYALHGAMILYLSFDLERYWNLIRFLAVAALLHGLVIVGIDWSLPMPLWWRLVEGPGFAATGALVLWLQHRVTRRDINPS